MAPRHQATPPADDDEEDFGEFLDDDHAAIVTFAGTYLEEDEREDFINGLMERRGYQRVQSWAPPESSSRRRPVLGGFDPDDEGGQAPRPRAKGGKSGKPPYFKR